MISPPQLVVEFSAADRTDCDDGYHRERVDEFVRRWTSFHSDVSIPPIAVRVKEAPDEHVGLGLGTQLGLSVAAGLRAYMGMPSAGGVELAMEVGRGARSAVGTHGFSSGGFIVEMGKSGDESISRIAHQVAVPADWRFVLMRFNNDRGLSGKSESAAFAVAPPVPLPTSVELERIANEELVTSLKANDFDCFSQSLFRFGQLAGSCFAEIQGGIYNGEGATRLVKFAQLRGISGVGQSSWGPTVFALMRSEFEADEFREQCVRQFGESLVIETASPNNCGANVSIFDS